MSDPQQVARIEAALPAYEVIGEIGRGATGTVLRGRHRALDRPVAVKQLDFGADVGDAVRSRFLLEARTLSGFDHPHVVRVYDYVESDELCLLVMELLDGADVKQRHEAAQLGTADACAVGLAAASGLQYCHDRQILHRDIKPANLLFTSSGLLKVADFGLAKDLAHPSVQMTAAGEILGSPAFLAPEQITGTPVGPATDVYALASTLYLLLANRLPHARPSVIELIASKVNDPPAPLDAGVPRPIADVVMSGLAVDPTDRPPRAEDFGCDLARAVSEVLGEAWVHTTWVRFVPSARIASVLHGTPGSASTPDEAAAAGGTPTREVEVVEPDRPPRRVRIDEPLVAGRKAEGLQIADAEASRRHASMAPHPEGLLVEDLGSTNGTLLNGTPIAGPAVVRPGDRIDLGATTLWLLD